MRKLHYHLVDVFTNRAFGGNQLAVFTNGRGLASETMQALAKELNLSESTFVLPPQDPANHYQVRIFTPAVELPMAGHPTVGTSFILARERMIDWEGDETSIRLEEKVGLIPVSIRFKDGAPVMMEMRQPQPTFGPQFDNRAEIAEMLSLDVATIDENLPLEVVSCGVPFLFIPLKSLQAIKNIRFRAEVLARLKERLGTDMIFVFTREVENEGSTVHSRMFAPFQGIAEDPATGGASGPLGCYLVRHRAVPSAPKVAIISEQGIELGRPSFIHIRIEQENGAISGVFVGGECYYMGEGFFEIE